jgi:hypothetical protein
MDTGTYKIKCEKCGWRREIDAKKAPSKVRLRWYACPGCGVEGNLVYVGMGRMNPGELWDKVRSDRGRVNWDDMKMDLWGGGFDEMLRERM